jgi:protein tyrosine/serine phosphatase
VLARGFVLALALVLAAEAVRTGAGSNFHTVAAHRCYRSAQPSPEALRVLAQTLGIRTVVNLRGLNDDEAWYHEERQAAERLALAFVDAGLWSSSPPSAEEFGDLVRAIDGSAEPILLHCQSGIDRSGFAAAVYLLLKTDMPLDEASCQLSPRFGHNPWGRAACQDRVLGGYASWLEAHGLQHRPDRFRHWIAEEYRP